MISIQKVYDLVTLCLILLSFQPVISDNSLNLTPAEQKYLLALARQSIKAHLQGKKPDFTLGGKYSFPSNHRLFTARYAVFVTLDKWGTVRGCRGTLEPAQADVAHEVAHNAVGAAMGDRRFPPLRPGGIDHCRISITVMKELIPVKTVSGIPKSDGIVVRKEGRTGVVLPYEGSDPAVRLGWAYKKAGLPEPAPGELNDLSDVYVIKGERFVESSER